MRTSIKSLAIAAAVTGLFAGTALVQQIQANEPGQFANTQDFGEDAKPADKHSCKGKNECKGKGGCKTDTNECKGKNACKGKGGCKTEHAEKEHAEKK